MLFIMQGIKGKKNYKILELLQPSRQARVSLIQWEEGVEPENQIISLKDLKLK